MSTTVNEPLLRETLEWALREWHKQQAGLPSEWDQEQWLGNKFDAYVDRLVYEEDYNYDAAEEVATKFKASRKCGTACCIAGKVALTDGWKPYDADGGVTGMVKKKGVEDYVDVETVAKRLLGLSDAHLFAGHNTIRDLYVIAGELTDGAIEMPPTIALTEQRTTA